MVGAVRGIDPETGHHYDDTRRYIDAARLGDEDRAQDLRDQRPPGVPRLDASWTGRCADRTATSWSAHRAGRRLPRSTRWPGSAPPPSTRPSAAGASPGPQLRPIQQGVRIAGSAVTVSCHPGDNLMIHAAVEVCQAGDILVVTNTAPSTHGMFGELLATSLHGPRRPRAGHRRRRARHRRAARDGLPGVVAVRVLPGHGEGVAGLGQRAGGARRADRRARRRRLRRRRRRGRRARAEAA